MDHQAFAQLLGNYGEFVGAVAVVITLGYLALQIRHNTTALKSSTWQAIQNAEHAFDQSLVANRDVANIWFRGSRGGLSSLDDPTEQFQFEIIGKQIIDQYQNHHYQHEHGLIDPELWQTWVSQFDYTLQDAPGFADVLRRRFPHLRPSFQKFVDERLSIDSP